MPIRISGSANIANGFHSTSVHIMWIYYLVAYSEMLFEPELQLVGAVVVPLLLAALAIRVLSWIKSRRSPMADVAA
jgi:hypothetical protein